MLEILGHRYRRESMRHGYSTTFLDLGLKAHAVQIVVFKNRPAVDLPWRWYYLGVGSPTSTDDLWLEFLRETGRGRLPVSFVQDNQQGQSLPYSCEKTGDNFPFVRIMLDKDNRQDDVGYLDRIRCVVFYILGFSTGSDSRLRHETGKVCGAQWSMASMATCWLPSDGLPLRRDGRVLWLDNQDWGKNLLGKVYVDM